MSEEEKETIERIDYIQDFIIENGQYNADISDMQYFSKILNLIEKQQAEIEFQKDINKTEKERHKKAEKSLKGIINKQNKIIDKMGQELFIEI